MAVLLPGKFIYLAHPHTASSSMMLCLQDAFPEAYDLRPHHMSLEDLKGDLGASRMEQISQQRKRIWISGTQRRPVDPDKPIDPTIVQRLVTGEEHVFTVIRNPYDFLASCFVRRNRGQPFNGFVGGYNEDPYVRDGRLYYHVDDCDTIVRYENIDAELDALMTRLGLPTFKLGRYNETPKKKPWETYYDSTSFRLVNDRFAAEFSRFYEPRSS